MSNDYPITQVNATLFTIILGGTESLLNVQLTNGFIFEKVNIFDSDFKDKYVNASGTLLGSYCFSQLQPVLPNQAFFICITKSDTVPCSVQAFTIGEMQSQNIFNETMEQWKDKQEQHLRGILSTFRLYKDGNIEIPSVCFRFDGNYLINHLCLKAESLHMDKGEVFDDFYELTDVETLELNQIIADELYAFDLLVDVLDKFELGCKEFRDELAFKELITVGEVLLLNYNSQDNAAKKEKLSNRLAVWIGEDNAEIKQIHGDIIDYYKYRSDDTHEAVNDDITKENRKKLREYMRKALKKYIKRISIERANDYSLDFQAIRRIIVLEILSDVSNLQAHGIL